MTTLDFTAGASPILSTGALKIADAEIKYLESFLERGDRGGYYLALYNLTGLTQAIEQVQISTFSEGVGGIAYAANAWVQAYVPYGDYPGIYFISQEVAKYSLDAIRGKLLENRDGSNIRSGYINAREMFASADNAWAQAWRNADNVNGKDLRRFFPGNFLDGLLGTPGWLPAYFQNFNLPPLPGEVSFTETVANMAVQLLKEGKLTPREFAHRLFSVGGASGFVGAFAGMFFGKQLGDYTGNPERYRVDELPDGKYNVVTDLKLNKVVGVFESSVIPTTFLELMNRMAEMLPVIMATMLGGVHSGAAVAAVVEIVRLGFAEVRRSLTEGTEGFDGDINPLIRNTYSAGALFPLSSAPTPGDDTRWGTGGLIGVAYADRLYGGAGDDRMFGGSGGDELHGDDGADIIYGQTGADLLYGGKGADVLRGGQGDDTLHGGDGADLLDGGDITPEASGNDTLYGNAGNDTLAGGDGADTLWGGADNDLLAGGSGDDKLYGEAGNDQLAGGQGLDLLEGGAGNDVLAGHEDADTLRGGQGADQLNGGSGNDQLEGDEGNDVLDGDEGSDTLIGGTGDDLLRGGSGYDTYRFGASFGNDTIFDSDGQGRIEIDGIGYLPTGHFRAPGVYRSADNKVTYTVTGDTGARKLLITFSDRAGSITIENWTGSVASPASAGPSTRESAQNVTPGMLGIVLDDSPAPDATYARTYRGDQRAPVVNGEYDWSHTQWTADGALSGGVAHTDFADVIDAVMPGADRMLGLGGNDSLAGGDGADHLDGGLGDDLLSGGEGADTIVGGAGNDVIYSARHVVGALPSTPGYEVPADGPPGLVDTNQSWSVFARAPGWVAYLVNGALVLSNGDESQVIDDAGDIVDAGDGNDYVVAGHGADIVHLGIGDDHAMAMGGSDHVFGGDGNDVLMGGGYQLFESLEGELVGYHDDGDDMLDGGRGNDTLSGAAGADRLFGGEGDDTLYGFGWYIADGYVDGDDVLDGGSGHDKLHGGAGGDRILGGAGNDELGGDTDRYAVAPALHGADTLDGGDGNDFLHGDGGADQLFGGAGDDELQGDLNESGLAGQWHGDDHLDGGDGNDLLFGQGGHDTLDGGAGDDMLQGDASEARVAAVYHGNDVLHGGAGNDSLWGGGGNDVLDGGSGADYLSGEAGDDTYLIEPEAGFVDVIDDSQGMDRVVVGATPGSVRASTRSDGSLVLAANGQAFAHILNYSSIETIEFANGQEWTAGSLYEVAGISERARARAHDRLLIAAETATAVAGTEEAELLIAPHGQTTVLQGGAGNDTLLNAAGVDRLRGGEGDDAYFIDAAMAGVVNNELDDLHDASGHSLIHVSGVMAEDLGFTSAYTNSLELQLGADRQLRLFDPTTTSWELSFDDGSTRSAAEVVGRGFLHQVQHTLHGAGQVLWGGARDDVLGVGVLASNAVVSGGRGNDTIRLDGRLGNVVHYALGDGLDTLEYTKFARTAQNVLALGADIALDDVSLYWSGYEGIRLELRIDGTGGMRLNLSHDELPATPGPFDVVRFADGGQITWQDLLARGIEIDSEVMGDIQGTALNDRVRGSSRARTISTGAGDDTVVSGSASETIRLGAGNDVVQLGAGFGSDVIDLRDAATGDVDTLRFDATLPQQVLRFYRFGNDLAVRVEGSTDAANVLGFYAHPGEMFVELADGTRWLSDEVPLASMEALATEGADDLTLSEADDSLDALGGNDTVRGGGGHDQLAGGAGDDVLHGDAGNDTIEGGSGNDYLEGGDGNDVLDGGAGNDQLHGGTGTNVYRLGLGGGQDRIVSSFGRTQEWIEVLPGVLPGEVTVTADFGNLTLVLPDGSSVVAGSAFLQTGGMQGGVRFADGTTWDAATLHAMLDVPDRAWATTPSGILIGSGAVDSLAGSSGRDELAGLGGNDRLYGYGGNDLLHGGQGDDRLEGGDGNDLLQGGAGRDTLDSGAGSDVLEGGDGNDVLVSYGSATDVNTLDGGSGDDELRVGTSNDVYLFGHGDGRDFTTGYAGRLAGETNILRFKAGVQADDVTVLRRDEHRVHLVLSPNDRFDLGWTLGEISPLTRVEFADGSIWDESELQSRSQETVIQLGQQGSMAWNGADGDTVVIDLPAGWFVPGSLSGALTYELNAGYGAASELQIDPSTGRVTGTLVNVGQTQYYDIVATDQLGYTVSVSVTLDVAEGPNRIDGTLANDTLVGTSDVDHLYGLAGDDELNGGAEADRLVGGTGDDTYTVDNAGDVVVELAGEGTDTVRSSRSWVLGEHVEHLTLTGSGAIHATGNASANTLTGNGGNNRLDGGAGDDTLNGGAGADTMLGGAGDDTYVVERSADVVTELADEGIDTVRANVTWALGHHLEHLALTGSSAINGIGNGLDNVLTGNSANNRLEGRAGNDTLDGGAGTDTMLGGAGDDTYVVERSADVVTELANEGVDTVRSSVTRTLGNHQENLVLTGTAAINGTGNTLDNMLTGNAAANTLTGGAGHDTYQGGAGNDILRDTATTGSNDIYRWGRGEGADTLTDAGGTDRLDILAGVDAEQVWLRRNGSHLEVSVIGTTDRFTVNNWYTQSSARVESMHLSDGQALQAAQVQNLVDAMAAFAPPPAGQTTLPSNYQSALAGVIAANWN